MEEAEGSDDPAHSGDGVEVEEVVAADNDVHEDNDDADVLQWSCRLSLELKLVRMLTRTMSDLELIINVLYSCFFS